MKPWLRRSLIVLFSLAIASLSAAEKEDKGNSDRLIPCCARLK
jgi:hypothetical protein